MIYEDVLNESVLTQKLHKFTEGKSIKRWRRKAMSLKQFHCQDRQVTENATVYRESFRIDSTKLIEKPDNLKRRSGFLMKKFLWKAS